MKTTYFTHKVPEILALLLGIGLMNLGAAYAEERDMHHEHEGHRSEQYRTEHWVYDDRHHHAHYYPALGYNVSTLPFGYLSIGFGGRRFFFQSGVWYEPVGAGFAVIRPPLGILVPVLPPDYSTVWVAGIPYYYANDIYYRATPGGYVVVNPPAVGTYIEAPPTVASSQTPPPAPAAAQPAPGTWYYCASKNTYYPYVSTCEEGWKPVPATAPPHP